MTYLRFKHKWIFTLIAPIIVIRVRLLLINAFLIAFCHIKRIIVKLFTRCFLKKQGVNLTYQSRRLHKMAVKRQAINYNTYKGLDPVSRRTMSSTKAGTKWNRISHSLCTMRLVRNENPGYHCKYLEGAVSEWNWHRLPSSSQRNGFNAPDVQLYTLTAFCLKIQVFFFRKIN